MEKQEQIVEMFNEIAPTYDKANRFISFGIDTSWRKKAVKIVLEKFRLKSIKIADVACGTGDMIGVWQEFAPKFDVKIEKLLGIDPSVGMLDVAKKRFPDLEFIVAKADNTTLNNDFVDILSISYGIRNVVERAKALKEFNRVIKNGGYVVILEFTKRQNSGFVDNVRDFYISKILPKIGAFISKNRAAYEYLPNSIGNFLDKKSFVEELRCAGFEPEIVQGFSFDVSTLFVAKKVKEI